MNTAYFYTYNAIFDADISGYARLVYAYLCKCADADGKCYPSHKTIGAAAGIGITTVKKSLQELEAAGLILIRGQARPDHGRRANLYTIIKEKVKGFFLTYGHIFMEALTAKARIVYLYFCRLASGRNYAYPSHKTTAKACGLSVAGTRMAIDELEEAGLISRQAQYRENGGQRSNLYAIVVDQEETAPTVSSNIGGEELVENPQASETPMLNETFLPSITEGDFDAINGASKNIFQRLLYGFSIRFSNFRRAAIVYCYRRKIMRDISKKSPFHKIGDDRRDIAAGMVDIKHPPVPYGGYQNFME